MRVPLTKRTQPACVIACYILSDKTNTVATGPAPGRRVAVRQRPCSQDQLGAGPPAASYRGWCTPMISARLVRAHHDRETKDNNTGNMSCSAMNAWECAEPGIVQDPAVRALQRGRLLNLSPRLLVASPFATRLRCLSFRSPVVRWLKVSGNSFLMSSCERASAHAQGMRQAAWAGRLRSPSNSRHPRTARNHA